jgi:hypothetical protein
MRGLFLLAVALWVGAAAAQDTELSPSAAVVCMTPAPAERGRPEYPAGSLARKDGGTLYVELVFVAPDAEPRMTLRNSELVFAELIDAVRTHVKRLRVPCMVPGRPVTLLQTYVFTPNDGRRVVAHLPTDPAQLAQRQLLPCMTHVDRVTRPNYPTRARREEFEGKVALRLRFTLPDASPTVEQLAPEGSNALTHEAVSFARGLRLPCLQDEPVQVDQIYVFKLDGGQRTVLKPLTLQQLVQAADKPQSVYLDLDSMACPFDLHWRYYQPHAPNAVREFETSNPARRPLLDWLSLLKLNLPPATNTAVLGDTTVVGIPCGKVDL